jgi:tetratricopeptide (TPR) repeat protein
MTHSTRRSAARSGRTGLLILLVAAACGSGIKGRIQSSGGKKAAPKLEPVKPEAMREFEAAMRAIRLGGPEAPATAKARLEAAVKLEPKLWEAWHDLGVMALREGDADGAIGDFDRALAVNPGHAPSRLARAEAHRAAGHGKDARGDYEAALRDLAEDDPLRKDAAARLASMLRDASQYDDAIAVLRETLRTSGASSRIYSELGLVYLAQKHEDLAALVLARAAELGPKDPAVYNAEALLALQQGKAQEAFDRFDYATSLDPAYLDARFNKATVLLDAGDYTRAKQELVAIVERKPDDLAAQVALGVAWRGLKDYKAAQSSWDKVVLNAPRHSSVHADAAWNLVLLKADFLKDQAGAKADLERFLQEAPADHPKRKAAEQKRKELGL